MVIVGEAHPSTEAFRVTIAELLVWTCGVGIGIRSYQSLMPGLQDWNMPLGLIYTLVMGFASGTFVSATAILAYHRLVRHRNYRRLPGHSLILLGFAVVLAELVPVSYDIAVLSSMNKPEWAKPGTFLGHFFLRLDANGLSLRHQSLTWCLATAITFSFFWSLRRHHSRAWAAVFCLIFVSSAVLLCGYLPALFLHHFMVGEPRMDAWLNTTCYRGWIESSGTVCAAELCFCMLGIVLAVGHGLWRRAPTDWLHWMGIGTWLAVGLVQITIFAVLTMKA